MPIEFSRKQIYAVIALILILAGAAGVFVLLNQPTKWTTVASWNGQTTEITMKTESFKITGPEWRVNWQINSYNDNAYCNILIYNATSDQLILARASGLHSGEVNLNSTGTFYLNITAHGWLTSWAVYVSQRA